MLVASGRVAHNIDLSYAYVFASGALLTASMLHIVPEAMEGLESKYPDDLHGLALRAGVAILAGVFFGVAMHVVLESGHSHAHGAHDHNAALGADAERGDGISTAPKTNGDGETQLPEARPAPRAPRPGSWSVPRDLDVQSAITAATAAPSGGLSTDGDDGRTANLQGMIEARKGKALLDLNDLQPVCWTVIVGDLVHNFADGITIGAAFLSCSSTVGWTVTASAVLHELPHELADFMALINGGMSLNQVNAFDCIY